MTNFFSKARAYFDFRRSVIRGYQHIFDDVAQNFLDAVAASLPSRFYTLEEGSTLSRARRGCEWIPRSEDYREAISFAESGMKPDADKSTAGRANSIRKPVFYGATDDKTAVSEVRPWIGALVSVARFRALKELQLVNCADPYQGKKAELGLTLRSLRGTLSREQVDECVWHDIGAAFCEPVTLDDDPTAYLPTQILAELFKRHGGDGVAYGSSVAEGFNVAIFDLDAVGLECSRVVKVSHHSIELEEGPFY